MRRLTLFALLVIACVATMGAGFRTGSRWGVGIGPGFAPMQRLTPLDQFVNFRNGLVVEILAENATGFSSSGKSYIDLIIGTSGNGEYAYNLSRSYMPIATNPGTLDFYGTGTMSIASYSTCSSLIFRISTSSGNQNNSRILQTSNLWTNLGTGVFLSPLNKTFSNILFPIGHDVIVAATKNASASSVTVKAVSSAYSTTIASYSFPSNEYLTPVGIGNVDVYNPGFFGRIDGLWGWNRELSEPEMNNYITYAAGYSMKYINLGSFTDIDGMTLASSEFRIGLQTEILKENAQTYASGSYVFVYQINDSSGNNRHASQTTEVNMPRIATGSDVYMAGISSLKLPTIAAKTKTLAYRMKLVAGSDNSRTFSTSNQVFILGYNFLWPMNYTISNPKFTVGSDLVLMITYDENSKKFTGIMGSGGDVKSYQSSTGLESIYPLVFGCSVPAEGGVYANFIGLWAWEKSLTVTEMRKYIKACEAYQ